MPDNGWTRSVADRSIDLESGDEVGIACQPDRISQADSFRDLGFAVTGMLTLALIANLLVLSL